MATACKAAIVCGSATCAVGRVGQQKCGLQVCFGGGFGCGRELPCGRDEGLFDGIVALNPSEAGERADNRQDGRKTSGYQPEAAPLGFGNALGKVIGADVDDAGDQLNPR